MIEVFSRGWRGSTATQSCRLAIRVIRGSFAMILVCSIPAAYAKCPVSEGTTLVVRAEPGISKSIPPAVKPVVEVQVDGRAGPRELRQRQGRIHAAMAARSFGRLQRRKISISDLVTQGGNINVGDVDGNVVLRTSGGSVTAGQIKAMPPSSPGRFYQIRQHRR